jgi:hypothetical protein
MEKIIILLTSVIFFFYGLLFVAFPQEALYFLVQSKMDSSSGIIDLRATYGGMSMSIGLVLYILAKQDNTLYIGLLAVLLLMSGMALGRLVGMTVDGNPNYVMYIYLVLELFVCVISGLLLKGRWK